MEKRFEVVDRHRKLTLTLQSSEQILLQWVEVFWVKSETISESALNEAAKEILLDPLLHVQSFKIESKGIAFEKRFHPGMTDNRAKTLKEAFLLYFAHAADDLEILSGDLLVCDSSIHDQALAEVEIILKKTWMNPWIHSLEKVLLPRVENRSVFRVVDPTPPQVEFIKLLGLSDAALVKLSEKRMLALSLDEMKTIQAYYQTLQKEPTDAELEIIAQTWSEHCKHKIFAAEVNYEGAPGPQGEPIPTAIKSLFKTTIDATTAQNKKPWLLSVFKDNAGIVAFSDDDAICLKVETHNSPSALDPFGGAITGIVGVNRDILGTGIGARPIFNTNVFCVGPVNYLKPLPDKIHHPRDLLEGVRQGVEHGGNQSGIPTINGAVLFDESYMGKPLIFVGSGGILPRKINGRSTEEKKAFVGDLIYMVGGRIGKDGIHGATFSSLALEDGMPSSVVQLGDPITQKRMSDFLLKARDLGLIQALTDNGAGGLSSSVGEIANLTGGAKIELSKAKTKYPGMSAWELVVSESQERMTVIVRPENKSAFESLSKLYQVESSNMGTMNDSGRFEVFFHGERVVDLTLDFLHDACPRLKLNATWNFKPIIQSDQQLNSEQVSAELKTLIASPNIASKEWIIRQYDHEVQGCSVVKPLQTSDTLRSSPNNAGVQRIRVDSDVGVVISCGLNPALSKVDPWLMAEAAVDEAVRNALCVGAEFSTENQDSVFALVDNFCWPDPTVKTEIMGALVRTCFGMKHAANELKLPFISGKDSMKNDYRGTLDGKPVHIAVLPTLLVSAMARMKNVNHARTSEFKKAGDLVYRLGPASSGASAMPEWDVARRLYNWLGATHSLCSLHDLSDGGLAVAITESMFSKNLGVLLEVTDLENASHDFWFGEGFHRFVTSVDAHQAEHLENEWTALKIPFQRLGEIIREPMIKVKSKVKPEEQKTHWCLSTEELYTLWKNGVQA